ncbi:hypothetical protein HDV05_007963 [Chytridiales sp. JEL 0842]|nr:hypothetical protein HDV05_007963 [Chytridiales sp. JEL 0842]
MNVTFPNTLPAIASWPTPSGYAQVIDRPSGLCWDAVLPVSQTQLQLAPCSEASYTQFFELTPVTKEAEPDVVGHALSLKTVDGKGDRLCVEFARDGILRLLPCRRDYDFQVILKKDSSTTIGFAVSPAPICIRNTPSPLTTSGTRQILAHTADCTSSSVIDFKVVKDLSTLPFPYIPFSHSTIKIDGLCLDASSSDGTIRGLPCDETNSSQQWMHVWGQIRNVETGLCLDVPDAKSVNGEEPVQRAMLARLSSCWYESGEDQPSMLWIKGDEPVLYNGFTAGCLRMVRDAAKFSGTLMLGTSLCDEQDTLSAHPKNFENIDNFSVDIMSTQTCTTPVVRKEVRDLTSMEQAQLFAAMNRIRHTPSLLGRANLYHDIVAIHSLIRMHCHGTPAFAPWHRYYITLFERLLQYASGNSSMALPYWDTAADWGTWYSSSTGVLTPTLFGTTGANTNGCVTDGFMNGTWFATNNKKCLTRYYRIEPESALPKYNETYMLQSTQLNPKTKTPYTSFDEFRKDIEYGMHMALHLGVAGDFKYGAHMGNPVLSPNDPSFWILHTNVDRYYTFFQMLNPGLKDAYDGTRFVPPYWWGKETKVGAKDILAGFNVPVEDGIRLNDKCVRYEPYSKATVEVPKY